MTARGGLDGDPMRPMHYTLDANRVPVPCFNVVEWSEWWMRANRQVAITEGDSWRVSTVFLGIDHNWRGGDPVLFETMVFWDGEGDQMERYRTWAEAAAGHERIASMLEHEARQAQHKSLAALKLIQAQHE